MYYSKEHEWIAIYDQSNGLAKVGITDYAQGNLGDIVYIDTPEIGSTVNVGDEVAVVESAKVASDIYAPVSGEIIDVNQDLSEHPSLVNESPLEKGWLFSIKLSNPLELESLLSKEDYESLIQNT